jgi:hypothetical protein
LLLLGGFVGTSSAAPSAVGPTDSRTFTGSFTPEQIVSVGGTPWVVGATEGSGAAGCAVAAVDAATLGTKPLYVADSCPYVAAGGGHLYLAAVTYVHGTNDEQIRIESVDATTDRAVLLAPVVMTVVGSAIAHIALVYGAGSLWLYGFAEPDSGVTDVIQISPVSGAILRTITGVPAIGGGEPAIAATARGLWLAGGAGSLGDLERVVPGSGALAAVAVRPGAGSVVWLTAVGPNVWGEVATFRDEGRSAATRLVAFDASGRQVVESPAEAVGDGPVVGSDRGLFLVGVGDGRCPSVGLSSYPEHLWRVDAATGASVVAATFRSPVDPCDIGPGSDVAVTGHSVFVLAPSDTTSQPATLFRMAV